MRFYLGAHKANWLADSRFAGVPLFVSPDGSEVVVMTGGDPVRSRRHLPLV